MRPNLALAASPLLLLLATPALAGNWASLGTDARGNAWHINLASVTGDQERVTAWKRIDFARPQTYLPDRAPVKRVFILSTTDCTRRSAAVKAMGFQDPEGSLIDVYAEDGKTIPWPPGTQAELLEAAMAMACTGKLEKTGGK